MDGSLSIFGRLLTLLRENEMSASHFVELCAAYGINVNGMAISRALNAEKFTRELDELLGPLVTRLERLVQAAGPFKISFRDALHTKLLCDLLDDGHEIVPPKVKLKEGVEQQ